MPSVQLMTMAVLVFVRLMVSEPRTGRRTVTVKLHVVRLLQASRASTFTVLVVLGRKNEPLVGEDLIVTLLHRSVALRNQKTWTLVLQVVTVMLVEQVSVGGLVSTTVTRCVQVMELLQQSVACQMPNQLVSQGPTVITLVANNRNETFVPQQASVAVGKSKVHTSPH